MIIVEAVSCPPCYYRGMADNIPTAKRILQALKDAGVPQAAIARKLVLPSSAVSNMVNGKRKMTLEEANKLLDLVPPPRPGRELPLIGMAGAGNWLEAIEEARQQVWIPAEDYAEGRFAVEVNGDSMNLLLPHGSIAVIDPTDTQLFSAKIYLLRNSEGEATIKRYRTDPSRFEPVSDNPAFVPFEIGTSDFRVIGRVTSGIQRF